MKHIFILNPAAGNGKSIQILPYIGSACKERGIAYEIHRTVSEGDAHNFVKNRTKQAKADDEGVRFYACGGDGTVNEVLNGFMGVRGASVELAIIPVGSGNDFVRNIANKEDMKDIGLMLTAGTKKTDVLRYELLPSGKKGWALNLVNMGFDAEVVLKMQDYKGSVLKGTAAYVAGVLNVLTRQPSVDLRIKVDGIDKLSGKLLMAGAANGAYSGGGFNGVPTAKIDDGLLDVLGVTYVGRTKFLSLVKKYYDGKHFDDPALVDIIHHYRGKSVNFIASHPMMIALDGETTEAQTVNIDIKKGAVKLVVL